ncbi:HPr family phosphocarrier protein [Qiania dongpingensis]|uniref:HPr family phosphocarrier protein n=1 Tax=Qiania dongpingensis TaxID=2763669 RepID=A0A7G9G6V2_9FIRM|nr:HPr family phosphocarrier protein [Qiania dongpingensis]QNM06534.1 HPr family phosphocarrier protein [Qiania dongpingensis]
MNKRQIKISKVEDAKALVSTAGKCNFDIDVYYNRMVVDAKSILGVMSLDFGQPLTVEYSGKDAKWERLLDRFALC